MNTNTLYKSDTLDMCYQYINGDYETAGDMIPSVSGLARYIGAHSSIMYEWQKKYPPIAEMIKRLLDEQQRLCISGGMSGKFNPTITKLILSKHGYSERIEQSVTHSIDVSDTAPAIFQGVSKDITPRKVEESKRIAHEPTEPIEPTEPTAEPIEDLSTIDTELATFKRIADERPAPICIPESGALARRRRARNV